MYFIPLQERLKKTLICDFPGNIFPQPQSTCHSQPQEETEVQGRLPLRIFNGRSSLSCLLHSDSHIQNHHINLLADRWIGVGYSVWLLLNFLDMSQYQIKHICGQLLSVLSFSGYNNLAFSLRKNALLILNCTIRKQGGFRKSPFAVLASPVISWIALNNSIPHAL